MDINAIHSITRAMHDGNIVEADAQFKQLEAAHPHHSKIHLAVAVVNDYLDIITPTDDVAPDAHLDDVGD